MRDLDTAHMELRHEDAAVFSLEALIQAVLTAAYRGVVDAVESLDCVLLVVRADAAREPVLNRNRSLSR